MLLISRIMVVLFSLALLLLLLLPSPSHSWFASRPPPEPTETLLAELAFRVRFGLLDSEPARWGGKLIPSAGQKLEVNPDEFRANIYRHSFTDSIHSVDTDPQLPNDQIKGELGWVVATRMSWIRSNLSTLRFPSIRLNVPGRIREPSPSASRLPRVDLALSPTDSSFFTPRPSWAAPSRWERIPPSSPISAERFDIQDFPSLLATRSGKLWAAWQEYVEDEADLVLARARSESGWGPVHQVATGVDAFRTALAEDSRGRLWVIWSMQVEGNWDLYARSFDGQKWSSQQRLTDHPSPDIYHRTATDSQGKIWLVWQKTIEGVGQIVARNFDGGRWGQEARISEGAAANGNNWWPSVAAGGNGELAVAWDGYASGSYDVYLRQRREGRWQDVETIAGTPRFEAGASVAIDNKGRTWLSWHESSVQWGKDTGRLVKQSGKAKGTELYESRSLRIACLADGNLMTNAPGSGRWSWVRENGRCPICSWIPPGIPGCWYGI